MVAHHQRCPVRRHDHKWHELGGCVQESVGLCLLPIGATHRLTHILHKIDSLDEFELLLSDLHEDVQQNKCQSEKK